MNTLSRILDGIARLLERTTPGGIIAAAVAARLIFGLTWMLFVNVPPENVPIAGDTWEQAGADGYIQIARTLLVSGEYAFTPGSTPVHNRPPLQVGLMLLFGAWWPGHWYVVWMFASALLSLAMLLGLRALARDLDFGDRAQRVLLLLAGFHPYMIFISKTTTFINAAAMLLVLVVLLLFRIRRHPLRYGALAGCAMGAGALTHGTFLLLPFLAAPFILSLRAITFPRRLAASALVIVAALTIVAPWTLRNLHTFDRFIPVVTGNGYHYWKGDAVYFGGDYPMARVYEAETGRKFEEKYYGAVDPDADAVLWRLAKADMAARPERIPLRFLIGTWTFIAPTDGGPRKMLVSAALNIPLVLALLVLLWRRRRSLSREQVALTLLLLYIVEAFAFFVSWGSYFTMLLPLALLLLVSLISGTRRHQDTKSRE
ncbi:MAG: hypothetical protein IH600_01295 [Bacteroidetes bacterium]|nr:hypothetical protein [Bacteroidota bacterium]